MKPYIAPALLLLILSGPARAQNGGSPGYEAELKSIQQDYQQKMSAFYKTVQNATADEWTKALHDPSRNPTKSTVEKLEALADKAKGSPVCVQAKVFAMQIAQQGDMPDVSKRLMADCVQNHIDSPQMEMVANMLGRGRSDGETEAARKSLKEIETKSPHHAVQAAAISSQIRMNYDDYSGSGDAAEAKRIAQRLAKDYADTQYGKRAGGLIFQIDHLQIGMPAPDIVGEDVDGVKFKLSDYKGKVVVIDFWGWW